VQPAAACQNYRRSREGLLVPECFGIIKIRPTFQREFCRMTFAGSNPADPDNQCGLRGMCGSQKSFAIFQWLSEMITSLCRAFFLRFGNVVPISCAGLRWRIFDIRVLMRETRFELHETGSTPAANCNVALRRSTAGHTLRQTRQQRTTNAEVRCGTVGCIKVFGTVASDQRAYSMPPYARRVPSRPAAEIRISMFVPSRLRDH
jgi:hypothetical protein